jgi:hypothetical protein
MFANLAPGRTAGEAILRIRHRHATQSLHLRDVNGRTMIRQTRLSA